MRALVGKLRSNFVKPAHPKPPAIRTKMTQTSVRPFKVGYVPEHFSTPIHFAKKYFNLQVELIPYPSGTGAMIQDLQSSQLEVGIGLTEGWVKGLYKYAEDAHFRIVGSYVKSPLCWAISTGAGRNLTMEDLYGAKIGISRQGSGSHVMPHVLADSRGWLDDRKSPNSKLPYEYVELGPFDKLRAGVNDGTIDAFMWEHFTSKKYWDNGEIKRIGEIYTPWASWKIVALQPQHERVTELLEKLNQGISYFNDHKEEAVEFISTSLDYSAEDAREWLKTVEFETDTRVHGVGDLQKTIDILGKAKMVLPHEMSPRGMIETTSNS